MKISEISAEAKLVIKDLFWTVTRSSRREEWQKAILFITETLWKKDRSSAPDKFIWRQVSRIMLTRYWKKFILTK